MADSLALALLVLLESLSPEQRAAFLLHEVFDEPYERIAQVIGTSEPDARQLAARARRHVKERRPRFQASREQREQLATRFFAAAEDGDLQGLEELLADDVVLHGDGGGKAPAIKRALHGRAEVARTLIGGLRVGARLGLTSRREQVNGQPGAVFFDRERRLVAVMILDIADSQIYGAARRPVAARELPTRDTRSSRWVSAMSSDGTIPPIRQSARSRAEARAARRGNVPARGTGTAAPRTSAPLTTRDA